MDPFLTAAIVAVASGAGASVITRNMGLKRRWRRLFTVACALVPPAGFLLLAGTGAVRSATKGLKRKKQDKKKESERERLLRGMTPKERSAFLRREGMSGLKTALAQSEAKVDAARLRSATRKERLMGRPGWDETNLHGDRLYRFLLSRQASAETAFRADRKALQEYMLSTSVRETDSSQRLFSIRCNRLADGTLTFELPYDAGAEVLNEIRIALSKDWGVALGDLSRAQVTEHCCNDFGTISLSLPRSGMEKDRSDSTVFVYDRTKGRIEPAGERLTPDTEKKIYNAMEEFKSRAKHLAGEERILFDREMLKGCITLHTLGLDTVALVVDGIAVAYATAGRDGGIHLTGDDVSLGDRKLLRTASSLNEELKGCQNFGQWLDRAIRILLSSENVSHAAKAIEHKQMERRIKEMPRRAVMTAAQCFRRKV